MPKYIDVDALGIGYAKREVFNVPEYADGWNSAIEHIEKAPAADVQEVRHAEWKFAFERRTKSGYRFTYHCSHCNRLVKRDQDEPPVYEIYPYCHCGAKMDLAVGE